MALATNVGSNFLWLPPLKSKPFLPGLSVSSRLLDTTLSYPEVESILSRLVSSQPIVVGIAKVLGYLEGRVVRFPRHATWCRPLNEVTEMSQPWRRLGHSAIHLTFQNGTKLLMEFGQHQDGEHQLFRRIGVARRQGRAPQSQLDSTG